MFRMKVIDLTRNGKEVSEPNIYRNHNQHKEGSACVCIKGLECN